MKPHEPVTDPATRPIHRAIDTLTSLKLDLQQLRRHLARRSAEQTDAALADLEQRIELLGERLLAARDETAAAGGFELDEKSRFGPDGNHPVGPDGASDDGDT